MRSYLSLIPISARVHRRQNRMTLLCIIFAVFMVTAIFSMAEMGARMEQSRLSDKHGEFSLIDSLMDTAMGQTLMITAAGMFLLVLIAGVLMISSSINSSVAQRTQFFGMMRCIGMSKQQIIRFVRLEALNWCKTAVPIGLVLGILTSWVLCAALRFLVGEEFSNIPLFGISGIGIVSGILVGVITVLLAARTPAKHAARVSPVAAVSGNSEKAKAGHHAVHTIFLRIETALGIHHAVAAKKNLFLMTGSFALSIILFLSFSVLIDFVDHLMPQSAATSDIDISSSDGGNSIDSDLVQTLSAMEGVKQVYGRRSSFDVAAGLDGDTTLSSTLDLVSFDDFDLKALQKDGTLRWGSDLSEVYGDSEFVLATWDQNSPWAVGDTILIGDEQITIAGLLKYDPFSGDGLTGGKITLITSDETFTRLTGITDYSLIMIQTTSDATDEDVAAIREIVEESGYTMNDKRDERTSGTYFAFVACVYAFLGIITLVTVLNIVNSISMSVSARIRQYGSMRAVGMDGRQLSKMILAEAFTYAFWGCIIGCAVGLPFSKVIYDFLITDQFPYASWTLPIGSLAVIVLFVIAAAVLAAYSPAKRMRTISVTETINEL
ncbi:ABC transporter permease [Eisenbergiella tayi]|uniref:ABC transporter permease n=1 Tax=Eisenbergiella porci TaxID=2652274 RepID=A0A6N7WJ38_9FIRM|nr:MULTISPECIES: ABC transporter permease [Eisenbergiella]MSS90723.1 ABC transporter permease [Eisenbergiella porci]